MKTDRNILIAFILNFLFSIFELFGGVITNSVAILSDSIHDMGDALSIGVSYFLENKSKQHADNKYTYGYIRFSVLGGIITTTILLVGSILVIIGAIRRIIHPVEVNYSGMIIFAVIGVVLNFIAAYVTREGDSLNQKAVNLHMLEDVFGWLVVLIGAIIMNYTDIKIIDPIMSIGVALFIFISALKNLKEVLDLFLEKTPDNVNLKELKKHLLSIKGVSDVHHIHVRSIDGYNNFATLHAVVDKYSQSIKEKIKEELCEHNIHHSTIELELVGENCSDKKCEIHHHEGHHHHHH